MMGEDSRELYPAHLHNFATSTLPRFVSYIRRHDTSARPYYYNIFHEAIDASHKYLSLRDHSLKSYILVPTTD